MQALPTAVVVDDVCFVNSVEWQSGEDVLTVAAVRQA